MARLRITDAISLGEEELEEHFVRASGPGGQNVNKVATAVQLFFDAAHSPSLGHEVRARLLILAGRRATKDGVIVIVARRHRTQEMNRADARARLFELIARAANPPKPRRKTRVPKASKEKRIESKKSRGTLKRMRARPGVD